MAVISAGVLAWRRRPGGPQFLLVHPGGPYWAKKDAAGWSIPKGLVEAGEDDWAAARREFREELGLDIAGEPQSLTPCVASGKVIQAWLVEADLDVSRIVSNTFETEWPPRSGRRQTFPEVDRAGWFEPTTTVDPLLSIARQLASDAGGDVAPALFSISSLPHAVISTAATNADAYGKIVVLFIVSRDSCRSFRCSSRCLRPLGGRATRSIVPRADFFAQQGIDAM